MPVNEENPLERCPRCEYSFEGLPEEYACPECGLRYDARSRIFRATNTKTLWFLSLCAAMGLIVGPMTLIELCHRPTPLTARDKLEGVFSVLIIVTIVPLCWREFRNLRRGVCVAILTDGLFERMHASPERITPWAKFEPNKSQSWPMKSSYTVKLKRINKSRLMIVGGAAEPFDSKAQANAFVEEVQRRILDANKNLSEPSNPTQP